MKTRGERLAHARREAGFKSSRAAAIAMEWPISTYNSHERAEEPGGRDYGPDEAIKYARRFGVTPEWLLTGSGDFAKMPAPEKLIPVEIPKHNLNNQMPVLGVARGGAGDVMHLNGTVVEYVAKPASLANVSNPYGLYVEGDSMEPVFRQGDLLEIHPGKKARVTDRVVVQLKPLSPADDPQGFVKEFVKQTASHLILRQYNPAKDIEIPIERIDKIHVIVGVRLS